MDEVVMSNDNVRARINLSVNAKGKAQPDITVETIFETAKSSEGMDTLKDILDRAYSLAEEIAEKHGTPVVKND